MESLRGENIELKKKLNPQRMRQIRKEQQHKQQDLMMRIQELEHQIYYGNEVDTRELDQARASIRGLRATLHRAMEALSQSQVGRCCRWH